MTEVDKLVSSDLSAFAVASRSEIFAISELRVLRAPDPARRQGVDPRLLAFGQIYAARIARIAGGVTALLAVTMLLAIDWLGDTNLEWIADVSVVTMAVYVAVVVLAVRVIASSVAARRFEAAARDDDPIALGHELARRNDAPAVAAELAGTIAVAIMFGMLAAVVGPSRHWAELVTTERAWLGAYQAPVESLNNLTVALAVVVAGAIAVGFGAPHRSWPRVFERAHVMIAAIAALLATVVIGLRLDVGPLLTTYLTGVEPSNPLRIALTVTGSASTFAILAGVLLRRRRAELARMSG